MSARLAVAACFGLAAASLSAQTPHDSWSASAAESRAPIAIAQAPSNAARASGAAAAGPSRSDESSRRGPSGMPVVELTAGFHRIRAEVAATPEDRSRGLMFRERLAPNEGMIFLFERAGVQCMWMRNTLVPLSVAFLDSDGLIVNIADMEPLSEVSHCSEKPVSLALEMERGWFAQRGLGPGARIRGIPQQN